MNSLDDLRKEVLAADTLDKLVAVMAHAREQFAAMGMAADAAAKAVRQLTGTLESSRMDLRYNPQRGARIAGQPVRQRRGGTGTCACGARISANKAACATCARKAGVLAETGVILK